MSVVRKETHRVKFPDGSQLEYDDAEKALQAAKLSGGKVTSICPLTAIDCVIIAVLLIMLIACVGSVLLNRCTATG